MQTFALSDKLGFRPTDPPGPGVQGGLRFNETRREYKLGIDLHFLVRTDTVYARRTAAGIVLESVPAFPGYSIYGQLFQGVTQT